MGILHKASQADLLSKLLQGCLVEGSVCETEPQIFTLFSFIYFFIKRKTCSNQHAFPCEAVPLMCFNLTNELGSKGKTLNLIFLKERNKVLHSVGFWCLLVVELKVYYVTNVESILQLTFIE